MGLAGNLMGGDTRNGPETVTDEHGNPEHQQPVELAQHDRERKLPAARQRGAQWSRALEHQSVCVGSA